ncbi:MAG: hypothetical protein A2W90_02595 [Bacteroidetes bacterium GWF2_42_66]|nr:MAG: hypothetical protein A2W89_16080 [Bacteroidetes bacterium GWE2_42_39]OFY42083.1 MAG: hypothetical protein A2W90_02595 [Bacteroidetes bacterium GWF2_42_66]HBL77714.1 hypothetical protein [Prolixibacteraceae bacterium]HCB62843.1 hypothetical protein [Bacteroidales bacterium]HCR91273.1 hypothetical protein [Prolixibacteraceae bacterium]
MKKSNPKSSIINHQSSIKILTFTPVWRRHEIFYICLEGIKRIKEYDPDRFDIRPFFMVSENAAARMVMSYGFDFIFVQNAPLGNKKNEGLQYAFENYEFDYILEIGSDDLITNAYLDRAEPLMRANAMQFHPSNCWFYDTISKKAALYDLPKIIGLGRFISREAISRMLLRKRQLWNSDGVRGMDTWSWRQLQQIGIESERLELNGEIHTLDIKSEININQMFKFDEVGIDPAKLLNHFPEKEKILAL